MPATSTRPAETTDVAWEPPAAEALFDADGLAPAFEESERAGADFVNATVADFAAGHVTCVGENAAGRLAFAAGLPATGTGAPTIWPRTGVGADARVVVAIGTCGARGTIIDAAATAASDFDDRSRTHHRAPCHEATRISEPLPNIAARSSFCISDQYISGPTSNLTRSSGLGQSQTHNILSLEPAQIGKITHE